MEQLRAKKVLSSLRKGSSLPVVVETDAGRFVVKLRGAAQGTAPLVSEIVVAEIAEALDLSVPRRVRIEIIEGIDSLDRHEELRDLLRRSVGTNLGFQLLEGAKDLSAEDSLRLDPGLRAQILWLDSLVMNVDRTRRNPNLMVRGDEVWLIDHGAALTFHFDWADVREESARRVDQGVPEHLFSSSRADMAAWDPHLAARLPREALELALGEVPDDLLSPLLPASAGATDIERERQAYVAFLWKRLKAPPPFV